MKFMTNAHEIGLLLMKTVPSLEGAGDGRSWQGQTHQDLQVRVGPVKGKPGMAVSWMYFDSTVDLHQHRVLSVTVELLPNVIKRIVADCAQAVAKIYRDEVSKKDPALALLEQIEDDTAEGPIHPVIKTDDPLTEGKIVDFKPRPAHDFIPAQYPYEEEEEEQEAPDPVLSLAKEIAEESPDVDPNVEDPRGTRASEGESGDSVVPE